MKQFTGRDSTFEPPEPREAAELILNTDEQGEDESIEQLYLSVHPRAPLPNA